MLLIFFFFTTEDTEEHRGFNLLSNTRDYRMNYSSVTLFSSVVN